MKQLCILFSSLLLVACSSNPYKASYAPANHDENVTQPLDLEFLKDDQTPVLIKSKNPERDMSSAQASNYFLLGTSSFTAPLKNRDLLIAQAKDLKATLVIYHIEFPETVQGSATMPTAQVTNTFEIIARSYSGYTYEGDTDDAEDTETSAITDAPFIQSAAYFVKNKKEPRFGIKMVSLTETQRAEIGKNTGAMIRIVFNKSPASKANLMKGDVLTEINQAVVTDDKQAYQLLEAIPAGTKKVDLKIIRNYKEMIIPVVLED